MDWKIFETQKKTGIYEKWTYFGIIIPERFPVNFERFNQIVRYDYDNLVLGMDISIFNSQLKVDTYVISGNRDINSLMNITRSYVISIIDIIVYTYGIRLSVDIASGINPKTNTTIFFGGQYPSLNRPKFNSTSFIETERMFKALTKDSTLNYILADFRQAMFIPLDTAFYCYRSIERMMQSLKTKSISTSGSTEKDTAYWKSLQERLNVSKDTLISIKTHSENPRHGKPNSINTQQIQDIFSITNILIERYIHYLIDNFKPLSISEFPIINTKVR